MKKGNKILMALLIGSMTLIGAAGVVSARGHGYGGYGGYGGNGYSNPFANLSPEARQSMIDAREAMTPLFVQYRAKRAELNAKIYSGADDRTIQALGKEVEALHSQLLAARVNMEKQMAKAGVPMRGGMGGGFGGCPGWGQGGMGGGMGGRHGGGHGGGGWGGGHGWGGGPGSMMHDGYMYNNPMPQTMPQQQGGQNNR